MADESKYPTRIAPYGLRMPDDLKARVQSAADANNRSMNAEIVAALEEKFPENRPAIIAQVVGAAALLDLANAAPEDRAGMVLSLNERLSEAGTAVRLALRKGKVETVAIGNFWTPDMAIEP